MKIESLPIIIINLVAIDVCLIIDPRSASLLGQIVFHFHKYFCVFKIENNSELMNQSLSESVNVLQILHIQDWDVKHYWT